MRLGGRASVQWLRGTAPLGAQKGTEIMRKIAFGLLIALIAASPAAAKGKKKKIKAEPTVAELNDNGYRFVRDQLPVYWPTVVKAIVYGPTTSSK